MSSRCKYPWPIIVGRLATIPPNIIIEIPLPIPFSVTNSPNQTKNIVPAAIEIMIDRTTTVFDPNKLPVPSPKSKTPVLCKSNNCP